MSLSTPVVLIIFNRPELTQRVFQAIAAVRPQTLFVIADGPRSSIDVEQCQKTREIIERIDWNCRVFKNYSDTNLGCGIRPATGLDWVFSQCEEAIILEDDCLPAPSFFYFCQNLLEYYRNDERIMHISGNNFQNGERRTTYSYYFSKYTHNWGWATWKRAWQYFDYTMKTWPDFREYLMRFVCEDADERHYWTGIFEYVYQGRTDIWDVQWLYSCWSQSGLAILPEVNLISNIGFGMTATHTKNENRYANLYREDLWEIDHSPFMIRHHDADMYTFRHLFQQDISSKHEMPLKSLQMRIVSFLKNFFYNTF